MYYGKRSLGCQIHFNCIKGLVKLYIGRIDLLLKYIVEKNYNIYIIKLHPDKLYKLHVDTVSVK